MSALSITASQEPDKGNVIPPKGVNNLYVKCVKCGEMFWLRKEHVCRKQEHTPQEAQSTHAEAKLEAA